MEIRVDEEFIKRSKLRKLKELYKSGPLMSRVINRIPLYGVHPNWRQIKNYSVQELDFLIRLRSGDTLGQARREYETEKNQYLARAHSRTTERLTYDELKKQNETKNLRRWNTFTAALNSKVKLTKEMQDELLRQTTYHSEYRQFESMGRSL